MLPFQERVIEEKKELDERLVKLTVFVCSETFKKLSSVEQGRLNQQHSIMEHYSAILGRRIAAFSETN